MTPVYIPADKITEFLPLIWPHIDRFCRKFPAEYASRDILIGLLTGQMHGFMVWDEDKGCRAFAYGVLINDFDKTRSLRMEMIEGEGLSEWRDALDAEFERFAKHHGCQRIRFIGRKGWKAVLPGWRVKYFVFERDI